MQRDPPSGILTWTDITSQSSQSLPGDLRNGPDITLSNTLYESALNYAFSTPFTGTANYYGSVETTVGAMFYSPLNVSIFRINYQVTVNDSGFEILSESNPTILQAITKLNQNDVAIGQSDIATFGSELSLIWINGTQPVSSPDNTPDSSFPFKRLASAYSPDRLSTFLYHQINDTTFAEEHWDSSSMAWLPPDYITIPDY